MKRARWRQFRESILSMRDIATDEQAATAPGMYPEWKEDTAYSVDERIFYGGKCYRCVQAHTSQSDWTPTATPALWTVVSLEEWPEFVQPTGAQDAYKTGDKVTYNGKHYVSLIDNNVWSPDTYPAGWQEQ